MPRLHRAALPRLTMNPARDELGLDGLPHYCVRPRSRSWRVLEALMRKAPRAVTTADLFDLCGDETTTDPKAAVYNVISRLRKALDRDRREGFDLLETCRLGGWRLVARCDVLETSSRNDERLPSLDQPQHH